MLRQFVVVLAQGSLLIEGIASLLREHPQQFKVVDVDVVQETQGMQKLIDLAPQIIILDTFDQDLLDKFPIRSLPEFLPNTKIIQLNCKEKSIQMYKSQQWHTHESGSLISIMQEAVAQ